MTGPVLLSLEVALVATAIATLLSLVIGPLLARGRWLLIDALLTTPLVLPPTVLGYFLLVALGRHSAIGRAYESVFGTPIVFSKTGLIIAAVVTSLPLLLQATRAAIETVDPKLIQAARTLGAGPFKTLTRIALPLASRGIAAGVVLAFARALGDFGVTLMIGGNLPGETQTGALAMYDAFIADRSDDALHLALTMAGLAVILVSIATVLGRKPHV